ncbi:response regulator transcription factor [Paraflavisolibacter sp. H34]|uniref:response regulator n=1 Tax=Huijunlia imazamoxiresistens TaxID=3127457 RepID=UPI003016EDFD
MKKTTIIMADHQELIRETLCYILNRDLRFEVLAECSGAAQAAELAGKLRPDIILMDLHIPEIGGVEATRRIVRDYPEVKVVGMSLSYDPWQGNKMIEAGARAYVAKDSRAEIFDAIREVAGGRSFVSRRVLKTV